MEDKKKVSREIQCYFRVGTYGISQIPRNHVVGEISLRSNGEEYIVGSTKSYHCNFERALINLYDRLLADKAHKSTLNSVSGLIDLIKDSKEEILQALK